MSELFQFSLDACCHLGSRKSERIHARCEDQSLCDIFLNAYLCAPYDKVFKRLIFAILLPVS